MASCICHVGMHACRNACLCVMLHVRVHGCAIHGAHACVVRSMGVTRMSDACSVEIVCDLYRTCNQDALTQMLSNELHHCHVVCIACVVQPMCLLDP